MTGRLKKRGQETGYGLDLAQLRDSIQKRKVQSSTRSLLRYPGSKARLAKFIAHTISMNGFNRTVFIEPFCGGASVSIALLESNTVETVVINDVDPIIYSLWRCIFSKEDAKWLADAVMRVPLDLDYWQYQKHLNPKSLREAALKCLYLNRTSFSGILHASAGPIGGRAQSKWSVGCRFNREKLSSRILELSQLSNRVRVITKVTWIDVCKIWEKEKGVFFYLDPPFYRKATRLYRFVFDDNDHRSLHDYLLRLKSPWVLSYDNVGEIRDLYSDPGLNARIIDNTYSAHPIGGNSFVGREVVYSNLKRLPLPLEKNLNHRGLSVRRFEKTNLSIDSYPMRISIAAV